MPLYDYECELCGVFTLQRSIGARDEAASCDLCGMEAGRVFSAPNLSLMNPGRAKAFAINERSRHEPQSSVRHRCSGGCKCTAGTKKETVSKFQSGKAGSRPWMLGH